MFKSTHNLPFLSANWNAVLNLGGWQVFKIGTVQGQWRATAGAYEILSFINDTPGNGHFQDVFDWFEHSAKRDGMNIVIRCVVNKRLAKHLVNKRNFIDKGNGTFIKKV